MMVTPVHYYGNKNFEIMYRWQIQSLGHLDSNGILQCFFSALSVAHVGCDSSARWGVNLLSWKLVGHQHESVVDVGCLIC